MRKLLKPNLTLEPRAITLKLTSLTSSQHQSHFETVLCRSMLVFVISIRYTKFLLAYLIQTNKQTNKHTNKQTNILSMNDRISQKSKFAHTHKRIITSFARDKAKLGHKEDSSGSVNSIIISIAKTLSLGGVKKSLVYNYCILCQTNCTRTHHH